MELIKIQINNPERYDELMNTIPDYGDLEIVSKFNGTKEGSTVVCLSFTSHIQGERLRVQTTTTLRALQEACAVLCAGDPKFLQDMTDELNRATEEYRKADTRIVYGARCSWWGSIHEIATTPSGLPCCPHCGGILMEVPDMETWEKNIDKYAEEHNEPDYREFLDWTRSVGRCWPSLKEAKEAFQ